MSMPCWFHTQVANRAHHSSHGPYRLQKGPRSASGLGPTWDAAVSTMPAPPPGGGSAKAVSMSPGCRSQYPLPSGVGTMAAVGENGGSFGDGPRNGATPKGSTPAVAATSQ